MKRLILLALPLLAACATPRETCLGAATQNLRVVDSLIAEVQANLQRGFAIREDPYVTGALDICFGNGGYWGGGMGMGMSYCTMPQTRYREVPVPIDPVSEKRKLADLQETRARLVKQSEAQVQQCNYRYPPGS